METPPPERQCTATSHRSGNRCRKWAITGTTVCGTHGGRAPQVKQAAARRVAAERAAATVESMSIPVDTTPEDALLGEVRHVAGDVRFLRQRIRDAEDQLVQVNEGPGGASTVVPSVWFEMYQQAHDRLVRVCAATLKAGVEERRVRLAEREGEVIVQVLLATLADLGVDVGSERVRETAGRHLRAVG